jgi:5-(carboxyamino)imidazole ribonucleotide synthase
MLNLIGEIPDSARTLDVAGAVLHDYGKAPREGRKLGHITVVADSAARRDERLRAIGQTVTGSTPVFGTTE